MTSSGYEVAGFQRVGAQKEKERRPEQEFILGIERRLLEQDLNGLEGE